MHAAYHKSNIILDFFCEIKRTRELLDATHQRLECKSSSLERLADLFFSKKNQREHVEHQSDTILDAHLGSGGLNANQAELKVSVEVGHRRIGSSQPALAWLARARLTQSQPRYRESPVRDPIGKGCK